ncbi:uncharacterized protein LOC123515064 isoform X2 [Portunus trituberculatus]|uniref:uncharacterized protein LOC123515064 isoform X2 n=1 Tax=Portunus trituberculatus TaxID=210409 RepID=UPI001E1CB2FB|nr:uncharacterized protein LOC123515064 isoform X2 [Portunus trituberculatus]
MNRSIAVVVYAVVASSWCARMAWAAKEGEVQLSNSGHVDFNHPIDEPLVMSTLTVGDDRKKILIINRERESDFERERRRRMEIAREREKESDFERERRRIESAREQERERNNERKEQINTTDQLVLNRRTSADLERRRERVRQEEIAREIHKAEERKRKILQEMARHDSLESKPSSVHDNRERNLSQYDSRRHVDRALREGDALERVERHRVRDTLRESWGDGRADSAFEEVQRPRHRGTIRRKPPILIIEQVPVRYSGPADHGDYPQTHFKKPQLNGHRNPETWYEESSLPGNGHDFEDPNRGKPFIDRRAPDRPVALPRPDTAYTDRRPDRPDYPYKYDEIHITIPGDSTEHQAELVNPDHIDHTLHVFPTDDLPEGQGSPAASIVRSPSLGLRVPHVLHHHIPSLGVGGNAGHAQLALEQALIAEQALQAQAIQAGQIKQAAVAAQLAGHVAAQHLTAQKVAAQKVAAQIIAAGSASANRKATQLSQILAGDAAVKAAIKTKLEHEVGHRLKKLLSHKAAGAVFPGPGVETELGQAAVAALAANSFHQHQISSANINQLREELIHRLTLLKPYFEKSSSGFAVPRVIPNLPSGTHLTPLQAEALPKITLQVPNEVVKPTSLHIHDLDELRPPLSSDYVEYLLNLPDDLFLVVTNLSKSQFLMALFPRLYRGSTHHLSSPTTPSASYHPPVYSSSTTPVIPNDSSDSHRLHPPSSSYGPPPVSPPTHTTLHPFTPTYTYEPSCSLLPVTPLPSPHKINVNRLFRGLTVAGFHMSEAPVVNRSISTILFTSTTLPPPLPSTLGFGEPKPSSIIGPSDLCGDCGNKHGHQHHHKHEQRNQRKHSHTHNTGSNEDDTSGHQQIYHHHVHHHVHTLESGSPAPSPSTTAPSHSSSYESKPSHHSTHGHLLKSKGLTPRDKADSSFRPEGPIVVSTTAPPVLTGVGLRPHGSQQQFITPISLPSHHQLSPLPVTPLFSTTTPSALLTSSYTSYTPTTSHRNIPSKAPSLPINSFKPGISISHSHSLQGGFSPSVPYFAHKPQGTSTIQPPFTTIHPFSVGTTTPGPHIPSSITPIFGTASKPTVPTNSPTFTVTEIPATTDSSTIFVLHPRVPLNGQFPPLGDGVPGYEKSLPDDSMEDTDSNNSDTTDTSLERLTLASKEGSDLDRVPGTDSNDDDHILSPFNRRKGNATDVTRETSQNTSTATSPSATNPVAQKKYPVPQLVGVDGLPLVPPQPGLLGHTFGSFPFQGSGQLADDRRPLTDEELQLPAYLKETPPCASVPTNKSFCLMPHGYPSELSSYIIRAFSEELTEMWKILSQIKSLPPDTSQGVAGPGVNTSAECEPEEKSVELSWSRDVLGNWFVILQTEPFTQPAEVTTCSAAARLKGCRPLLRPRPLLALQPSDPEPRPFLLEFPLPVACVFPESRPRRPHKNIG